MNYEKYNIATDVKYEPLVPFDVGKDAAANPAKWWNQTLCRVNDCVARPVADRGPHGRSGHRHADRRLIASAGRGRDAGRRLESCPEGSRTR
jgi:hypothetical protein